jgi:hypothetical protein
MSSVVTARLLLPLRCSPCIILAEGCRLRACLVIVHDALVKLKLKARSRKTAVAGVHVLLVDEGR